MHQGMVKKERHCVRAALLGALFITPLTFANQFHYEGTGEVTKGLGKTIQASLFECDKGYSRPSPVGEISDTSGRTWVVPADNNYLEAAHAYDLYDECTGNTPSGIADVDTDSVPVVTVDKDGDVVTGYIFADNYYELFINGKLIGVDSVPFTPFNSSIVKFKVSKPYTIAIKLIDWEENLGVGSERGRGKSFQPGDGGLVASFSDGTVTGAHWKAQTFYTSPIYDLSCLQEEGSKRISSRCDTSGKNSADDTYAVHWAVPLNWTEKNFDASNWPDATTYTEQEIGVNNKNGYMNFREKFTGAGATFIWSSNLILDNEVLVRYDVK